MRKLIGFMVIAAAALFCSAPGQAFAHSGHTHHVQMQAEIAQAAMLDGVVSHRADQVVVESISYGSMAFGVCPHSNTGQNCDFCCACAGGVSAALATQENIAVIFFRSIRGSLPVVRYSIRQASLDLRRPPKSFV